MTIHSLHISPAEVTGYGSLHPPTTGIATPSSIAILKPPRPKAQVFTPFSNNDLMDYDEFNWEATDGDLVVSYPDASGAGNVFVLTCTNQTACCQPPTLGLAQPYQITNGTNHDVFAARKSTRFYWGTFLQQLQTIDYFTRDALRLKLLAAPGKRLPRKKFVNLAQLQDAYMKRIFSIDLPRYPDFQFSEHIHLFIRHLDSLEINKKLAELTAPAYPPLTRKVLAETASKLFSALSTGICSEGHGAAFKKLCKDRQTNIQRNVVNYCGYVDAVLERNSPLLVLRIDLAYTPAAVQFLDIQQVRADIKRFLNNQRHKKIFAGQKGFLWKLQNIDQRGLHFHMMLLFADTDDNQQQSLTQQVGDYWTQVTGGRGCYQDCNLSNHPYKRIGIGTVIRHDIAKVADIHSVINYLCKRDQALTVKGVPVFHHARLK